MTKSASVPALLLLLLGVTCVVHVTTAQPTPAGEGQRAVERTLDEDYSELDGQPLIEFKQEEEPTDYEIQLEVPEVLVNFVTAVNDFLIPRIPGPIATFIVKMYILGLLIFGIMYSFYMLVLPIVYEPPERALEDMDDVEDEDGEEEEGDYEVEEREGANLGQDVGEDGQYLGYTHYNGEARRPNDQVKRADSFWTSRSRVTTPFMHRLIRSIDAFETTMSSVPEPSCTPQLVCETRQLMTYVPSFEHVIQTYGLSMNGLHSDYRTALENGSTRQSCREGQPLCTPSFVTWLLEGAKAMDRLWPIADDASPDFEAGEDELPQTEETMKEKGNIEKNPRPDAMK